MYKIAQLILTPGQRANTAGEIFVAQPDADKEALAGKLFILIEIESKGTDSLKIINFLTENLNRNYYQSEKMILRERVKTVKIEHIFESALAKTNKSLAEFWRAEKIKIEPRLINVTAGVIYENSLHFADMGKNKAFLIYKSPHRPVRPDKKKLPASNQLEYKIVDIIERSASGRMKEPEKEARANDKTILNKLFSNVISGSVPAGGYFLFANEALPEYLSSKQMVEIFTALPPASAVEQVKNLLSSINSYVSFLGIIIKNTAGAGEIESRKEIKSSSLGSISNLKSVEEKTEKLLSSGGGLNLKRGISFFSAIIGKFSGGKKDSLMAPLKDKIFFKKKTAFISLAGTYRTVGNIASYLVNFIFYALKNVRKLILAVTDKSARDEVTAKIKDACLNAVRKIKNIPFWFKNLSKKNKILLIIIVVFSLLFLGNLAMLTLKNKDAKENSAFLNLTELIKQKENQVEASLLYNNEDRAKKLLSEIRELLAQLPRKNDSQTKEYTVLFNKYNEQLEKIKHAIKIANPAELANFANLETAAGPSSIILAGNKIYAGDAGKKLIYSLDISNNLITSISSVEAKIDALKYPAKDKNDNIYYLNGNNIIQLETKTGKVKNPSIDIAAGARIVSTAVFNNKLYLLDAKNGQIYVYAKAGDAFPPPISWLEEKSDFADAVSLDIDGSIYVLKKDGQALKYLRGEKENFTLNSVEPSLSSPLKINAQAESDYIYILEPVKKRLIVYDKTGKFLTQYEFEKLADLKDFTVDEVKKTIYLLNGASVYKVEATHLEK